MISVLLATMDRPDRVQAFVSSLIATTRGHDIELVAAVDKCEESVRRLAPADGAMSLVIDWSDEPRGSSRAWNDALKAATGDPVVLAADDLEFQLGWLDSALACLHEFPDGWGLVGFNDGHWGPELSTHYLMSRRLIVEVFGGVVAWDAYKHSFNDREANARAQHAGRYRWCEQARVLHRHWLFGERPQDETDTRQLGLHPESERAFADRQARGFPDDQAPVIAC